MNTQDPIRDLPIHPLDGRGVVLSIHVHAHLARLRLAGYSERTVSNRAKVLYAFQREIRTDVLLASRYEVEGYLGRALAPASRAVYRAHLAGFYRWALEEQLIEADPMLRVPHVRVPRALPRPVTETELAVALHHGDTRMRAWLTLMAYGGLRCLEVAALAPTDIDPGPPTMLRLRVTKGGHEAVVPAHPAVLRALAELPVLDGAWWTVKPHTVSKAVSKHLDRCGIDATAHCLRHFAGTTWYRASGHDLLVTAQLLRHASVSTTQGYAQIEPTRAIEVVAAVNTVAI